MINDTEILKKLAKIKEIPTLPEVMQEVLAALGSDESAAQDLAAILSKDQALCSKMLKIANSAFFAQSRRIYDINDAIVLLGFDSIAHLMLTTSVLKVFGSVNSYKGFDVYGFWKHSMATAVAGKVIAETIGETAEVRAAYTAGLLHDIGKLVLVGYFPGRYVPVCEKQKSESLFLYEAEQLALGFTHCDVGEWLCNRWNFPEKLVRSIADHHSTVPLCHMDSGARLIRLADIFCNSLRIGSSGNRKAYSLDIEECSEIGLDIDGVKEIEQRLEESEEEIDSILTAIT